MTPSIPSLDQIRAKMVSLGARRLLAKWLKPNDNSKNGVYVGGDLGVMNILPAGEPIAQESGSTAGPIFMAPLSLSWMNDEGHAFPAPTAKFILYPQYPEVRISGFLLRAKWAPSQLMKTRQNDRVLLLGIAANQRIIAYAAGPDTRVANELRSIGAPEKLGVFLELPIREDSSAAESKERLLTELCRIARREWISGWTLRTDGSRRACVASNCVGVTLESELGITANGRSDPDFDGWEVKAHTVPNLQHPGSGAVTLMTPEPTGGYYKSNGVTEFVRRFGYIDKLGREDRYNFGGIHRAGEVCAATGLILEVSGYDHEQHKITRADGEIALVDSKGTVAASWNFAGLLSHWSRKHSRAVFVPALRRVDPDVSFRYGGDVLLATGTDYLRLLAALADGIVYYDPGIKVENWSTNPRAKKRSQFRISKAKLTRLYHESIRVNCCTGKPL